MNKTLLFVSMAALLLSGAVTHAGGQSLGKSRQAPPRVQETGDLATVAEVSRTMVRIRQVLFKAVLNKAAPKETPKKETRVASKADIIAEFNKCFEDIRPRFKMTPRMVAVRANVVTVPAQHPQRKPLEKLIKYGFVAPVGPLVASKREGLTLREFGDAVGYFLARAADLTHTPSSKFSPALMPPSG
jgi:hypothetical protein